MFQRSVIHVNVKFPISLTCIFANESLSTNEISEMNGQVRGIVSLVMPCIYFAIECINFRLH